MTIDVSLVTPEATRALRDLRRAEMDCQIILDSWHGRGWTDSYLLRLDGRVVGYGLVGGVRDEPRETVTEFYVLPAHRGQIAHAHLPLQQGEQQPQPARVGQQPEHLRGVAEILSGRHPLAHCDHPRPVHHPDRATVDGHRSLI